MLTQFPRVPGQFSISSTVFNSSQIAFSPKPNYVQQTLDFSAVLPLFNAVSLPATCALWLDKLRQAVGGHEDFHYPGQRVPELAGSCDSYMLSCRKPKQYCCCR